MRNHISSFQVEFFYRFIVKFNVGLAKPPSELQHVLAIKRSRLLVPVWV